MIVSHHVHKNIGGIFMRGRLSIKISSLWKGCDLIKWELIQGSLINQAVKDVKYDNLVSLSLV